MGIMVDEARMHAFKALVERHARANELVETAVEGFFVYKSTGARPHGEIYDSGIAIAASGRKRCTVNGRSFEYRAGNYLGVFVPVPVEVEEIDASPENPLRMVGLKMDLGRIAEMLLELDRLEPPSGPEAPSGKVGDGTGIFTEPLTDDLLEPVLRLLKTLDRPTEVAMLSGSIVDEIYYRVLTGAHMAAIRDLLDGRGRIQQIAKAVAFINRNLSRPVVVEELAARANMSVSHFHKIFKEVVQMSPLQYAKSMKLFRAQALIREGKKASQAAYEVGYNSPAQFSREYKRQFGFAPSAT